jgi:hypothetical protein
MRAMDGIISPYLLRLTMGNSHMTLNREVFDRDPTTFTIPNDGVAKVVNPHSDAEWSVLRYELQAFVCDGEYRKGLERILATFLANLNNPNQPAVWVSGFYGSGKSHLVRVLEYLWRDVQFPDGVTARGLARLPNDITDHLTEISNQGKRRGGLWSAAGTLGAGAAGNVRLALLAVLLRAAGLPEQYPPARFVIWLKQGDYYDKVKAGVVRSGSDFAKELNRMYVSQSLMQSLLDAYPSFASTPAAARQLIKEQFPNRDDITDAELLTMMEDVLTLQSKSPGKRPLTLLVFDELQQFLGEDSGRTLSVQNVVEACSSQFGSTILFLGTGQSALQATPQLQKLMGRFTVPVQLSDSDVDKVVREVVLRKKADREAELKAVLETASGEIDRQLTGSKIAPSSVDRPFLVADYPLLPARRRFWEHTLRAVDRAGTAGQLRTQLRIVHEATRASALQPLGTVAPGDFIYEQLKTGMLQSAVLLPDEASIIEEQDDHTPEGALRARVCALVFLIGKLPTEGPSATGLRATATTLADLLVENLPAGGSSIRQGVPDRLQQLVDNGVLMRAEDQYFIQTREGAEWERDRGNRYAKIAADDSRIASDRATEIRKAVSAALRGITLTQGASRTPRRFDLHFGADAPPVDTGNVPVWIRDEWSVSERAIREDAQAAGRESPIVFVFLPRRDPDALRGALAGYAAATATIDGRPAPATAEAIVAKSAMESKQRTERVRLDALIANLINNARVFQGGGNEVVEGNFKASVQRAVDASLVRLFPKFGVVDSANWGTVIKRATEGAPDALGAIGYNGDVDRFLACQEIASFIGETGKRGSEIRKQFSGAGYGWPQDAIDGSLLALVAGSFVRASKNGQPVSVRNIIQSQIGVIDFYGAGKPVTGAQRIAVKGLLAEMGFTIKPNEEAETIPLALQKLIDLADQAGGDMPMPEKPSTVSVRELLAKMGNDQMVAMYDRRVELVNDYRDWLRRRDLIAQRRPRWEMLQRLLHHARTLPVATELAPQADAVRTNRALLAEPDPVTSLLGQVTSALRNEAQSARKQLADAYSSQLAALEASDEWQKLPVAERQRVLEANRLNAVPPIDVGTDQALLNSLDEIPLEDWQSRLVALPARFGMAREQAAKHLEPKAVRVTPPSATLRTEQDVDAYLAGLRSEIIEHIGKGNPVII